MQDGWVGGGGVEECACNGLHNPDCLNTRSSVLGERF